MKDYIETPAVVENLLAIGIDPNIVEAEGDPENKN